MDQAIKAYNRQLETTSAHRNEVLRWWVMTKLFMKDLAAQAELEAWLAEQDTHLRPATRFEVLRAQISDPELLRATNADFERIVHEAINSLVHPQHRTGRVATLEIANVDLMKARLCAEAAEAGLILQHQGLMAAVPKDAAAAGVTTKLEYKVWQLYTLLTDMQLCSDIPLSEYPQLGQNGEEWRQIYLCYRIRYLENDGDLNALQ
ncbi:hypothetical protein Slin14017_G056930 [Septoria linicola]|nr:hypothetical protein Slin14017_G056930 [Septoria linicola]